MVINITEEKPYTVRFDEDDEQHSYNAAQIAAKFKLVVYKDENSKSLSKHKILLRKTTRTMQQLLVGLLNYLWLLGICACRPTGLWASWPNGL